MKSYRSSKRGFTLVEILIVVIILGILAAIVIPQFGEASGNARSSSMATQLQSIRSQLALYKLQHRDIAPEANDFWTKMTTQTDEDGNAYTAGTSTSGPFGPYFDAPVVNPLTNSSEMVGTAASGKGWVYVDGKVYGINKDGVQSDTGK